MIYASRGQCAPQEHGTHDELVDLKIGIAGDCAVFTVTDPKDWSRRLINELFIHFFEFLGLDLPCTKLLKSIRLLLRQEGSLHCGPQLFVSQEKILSLLSVSRSWLTLRSTSSTSGILGTGSWHFVPILCGILEFCDYCGIFGFKARTKWRSLIVFMESVTCFKTQKRSKQEKREVHENWTTFQRGVEDLEYCTPTNKIPYFLNYY